MNKVEEILTKLEKDKENINTINDLNELKVKYLGKKGLITELSSEIKNVPNEEKKEFGMKINQLKTEFNTYYEELKNKKEKELLDEKLKNEAIDITMPATKIRAGAPNILEKLVEEVEEIFMSMGYDVVDGPEVDSDENCFEKLNLPKSHPARDAQDSFYITEDMLLRPHTSSMQVRYMTEMEEKHPFKMICPGKTYRRDDDDATHSHEFSQVEGLVVGENISLSDLKGTLECFAKRMFGRDREIRFRASYFPFTEPSYEVDVSCFNCGQKGCNICKGTGWIEILGCGMVHPNVLENCGFDHTKYQGFAFGVGIERVASIKYGVTNMRDYFTNDYRFLHNFNRKEM